MELLPKWRPYLLEPSLKDSHIPLVKQWCENFGYPVTWAHPVSTKSNQQTRAQPADLPPRNTSDPTTMQANSLQVSTIGGLIRNITVKPRKVSRFVRPGFTSSGEQICMIQWLGKFSPRFVVMDSEGGMRLMSGAAAGGQPALNGAMTVNIPSTTTKPNEIKSLNRMVMSGGGYGLSWVAVGELHPDRTKLPFIVVGFWHQDVNKLSEVGISRSSLAKVVSSKEAERLISESLVGSPDCTVREALNMLAPGAIRDVPPPQLALPYTSHTHYGARSQRSHQPYGSQPYAGQPYAGQPHAGQPHAGQPYAGQPYAGQSYAGQSYGAQPHGAQPYGAHPYGAQPYGAQPYGAQPQQPAFPRSQYQMPRNSFENPSAIHQVATQGLYEDEEDEEEEYEDEEEEI
jgi:hypothetical protein